METKLDNSFEQVEDQNIKKCRFLTACIDYYLSSHKKQSLYSLEKKTGIHYSSLRRIVNNSSKPTVETAIKLLNSLGEDENLKKYLDTFHPEVAGLMGEQFSHNSEYEYISKKAKDYFTNPSYYLILNLASTTSGTTAKEITYHIGDIGLERLSHLIEEGLIIEGTKGRYFGATSSYKLPFSDTKKRVKLALDYYRLEEAGSTNNWLSFQTESLNEDGLKAMKELSRKHFNERKDQIYNNPMYRGSIKHYSACVSSTFLPYTENEGVQ